MSTETGLNTIPGNKWDLIKVGNRWMTSDGRWHDDLIAKHLLRKYDANPDAWTEIGDLARTAFGQNSDHNRRKVRERLPGLINHLLVERSFLLVTEDKRKPGTNIKVRWRVKIFNPDSMIDRLAIAGWIEKMVHTQELVGNKIADARAIAAAAATERPATEVVVDGTSH